jgi:hypothetical protein
MALAGFEQRLFIIHQHLVVLLVMVGDLYVVLLPCAWLLLRMAEKVGVKPA